MLTQLQQTCTQRTSKANTSTSSGALSRVTHSAHNVLQQNIMKPLREKWNTDNRGAWRVELDLDANHHGDTIIALRLRNLDDDTGIEKETSTNAKKYAEDDVAEEVNDRPLSHLPTAQTESCRGGNRISGSKPLTSREHLTRVEHSSISRTGSTIKVIHKCGDPSSTSNCRPICSNPILYNVFSLLLCNHD